MQSSNPDACIVYRYIYLFSIIINIFTHVVNSRCKLKHQLAVELWLLCEQQNLCHKSMEEPAMCLEKLGKVLKKIRLCTKSTCDFSVSIYKNMISRKFDLQLFFCGEKFFYCTRNHVDRASTHFKIFNTAAAWCKIFWTILHLDFSKRKNRLIG